MQAIVTLECPRVEPRIGGRLDVARLQAAVPELSFAVGPREKRRERGNEGGAQQFPWWARGQVLLTLGGPPHDDWDRALGVVRSACRLRSAAQPSTRTGSRSAEEEEASIPREEKVPPNNPGEIH